MLFNSLSRGDYLGYLNIAEVNCGHRGELLAHIPGLHSPQQILLEGSGVCLL